jgi:xylulokinase
VDLGTSETKAGLFDAGGNLMRLARRSTPMVKGQPPGVGEQEPQRWLDAVNDALREVASGVAHDRLAALCILGQGPSTVMVDERGQPVHNAILWMDTRPAVQRERLIEELGTPVSLFAAVPQVMWLRDSHDRALDEARWFMTAWDFVAYRLCGRAMSSTLASFDPFPAEERMAAGIPERVFPPRVRAGEVIAPLEGEAAERSGLPEGLPVVAGVHDGMATFIGSGAVEVGRGADVNGTSGGLALCWNRPINESGIFSTAWIGRDRHIVGGAMAALGKALDWCREVVASPAIDYERLIEEAVTVPPGAGGLIFLPYLAGERAPIWDPQARGVFFGLTLQHTRAHLLRAVMESVAYALRHLLDRLVACGARMDEMRVCGGQARSAAWNRIKADVLGVPVAVPRVPEAALMGAAVLAGVGAGVVPDVTAGANRMVRIARVIEPDPARHEWYSGLYDVYQRLYPDLRAAFHQLAEEMEKVVT